MAFVHGKSTRVLINELAASSKLNSIAINNGRNLASNMACYGDEGERFLPGLRTGAMTLGGPFEDNTVYNELQAANGVDNALLVSAGLNGFGVGQPVGIALSDLESHEMTSQVTDAVRWTVQAAGDEFVDWGRSHHDLTAETATGNGTAVDNAASSAGGGVGALHVTAYSGLTNVVFKIQHSVDNSVWVDLITFTTVSGVTSQRSTASGTVNRYTRATWTVTGTGSVTFAALFARR
jgi:hypothetical protein